MGMALAVVPEALPLAAVVRAAGHIVGRRGVVRGNLVARRERRRAAPILEEVVVHREVAPAESRARREVLRAEAEALAQSLLRLLEYQHLDALPDECAKVDSLRHRRLLALECAPSEDDEVVARKILVEHGVVERDSKSAEVLDGVKERINKSDFDTFRQGGLRLPWQNLDVAAVGAEEPPFCGERYSQRPLARRRQWCLDRLYERCSARDGHLTALSGKAFAVHHKLPLHVKRTLVPGVVERDESALHRLACREHVVEVRWLPRRAGKEASQRLAALFAHLIACGPARVAGRDHADAVEPVPEHLGDRPLARDAAVERHRPLASLVPQLYERNVDAKAALPVKKRLAPLRLGLQVLRRLLALFGEIGLKARVGFQVEVVKNPCVVAGERGGPLLVEGRATPSLPHPASVSPVRVERRSLLGDEERLRRNLLPPESLLDLLLQRRPADVLGDVAYLVDGAGVLRRDVARGVCRMLHRKELPDGGEGRRARAVLWILRIPRAVLEERVVHRPLSCAVPSQKPVVGEDARTVCVHLRHAAVESLGLRPEARVSLLARAAEIHQHCRRPAAHKQPPVASKPRLVEVLGVAHTRRQIVAVVVEPPRLRRKVGATSRQIQF